jgi:hypothetical protein
LILALSSEDLYRELTHKKSIKPCCLEIKDARMTMNNRDTMTVTLDDGYPCFLNSLSFANNSGYIKNAFERRWLLSSTRDIHNIHISEVRRDLWLVFQNFVTMKELPTGEGTPENNHKTEQAMGGKNDTRLGKWDPEIHRLVELMLMGEFLKAPAFMNAIMDQLISAYRRFYQENDGRVPLGNVNHIFENSSGSYLQRFIVDNLFYSMSETTRMQAFKEGHLKDYIRIRRHLRADDTAYTVRDAPWDHREQYMELAPWDHRDESQHLLSDTSFFF